MLFKMKTVTLLAVLSAVPTAIHAQEFKLFDRSVQVHGAASQGFMYSTANNYMTTTTKDGNFAFTDFAVNASTQVSEKFRIGGQLYDRNIGHLGNWHPTLDWASADYRFKNWLGVRGGQVKTTLGLYNDTQDMEFLHTWALLPQALYPIDLRGENIAHIGGDLYGRIGAKKLGSFAYTVYGGKQPADMQGGFVYGLDNAKTHVKTYGGTDFGADLRWTTPIKGLLVGSSFNAKDISTEGTNSYPVAGKPTVVGIYQKHTKADHTTAFYTQYTFRNFRFDGEYRRQQRETSTVQLANSSGTRITTSLNSYDYRMGYVAVAYRFAKWFEAGAYNSRYVGDIRLNVDLPANHIYDQALTARFDLNRFVDLKVEGHFMDGWGGAKVNRGFYPIDNGGPATGGGGVFNPTTNLLVIRTGFHF